MRDNVVDLQPHQPRQLPASEAAEHALLGAMMFSGEAIDAVAGFLLPEHFHFAGHGRIYAAAVALHRQGTKVDVVTLSGALQGDEDVAAIGGNAYLADLQASTFIARNAPDYGQVILDMALRRRLIGTGQEIIADAFQADVERPGTEQCEDAVQRMTEIAEAALVPQQGPQPIGDCIEALMDQYQAVANAEGGLVGCSTGLHDLDRLIGGLIAPDLLIVAARPGMGKSVLALNIARQVAEHDGPVAFYSLEMSREQMMQRLVAAPTGVTVERQRGGPIHRHEFVPLQEAAQEIARLPLLLDDGQQRTVQAMRAHSRRQKRRGGLEMVVVDYLQLMVQGDPRYRVQEVSQITRDLKMMAQDVGVPVLAVSQLSRQVESREDKRPQLSDLRESGSIEQDADGVVFLYREEYYLRPPKQRPGETQDAYWGRMEAFDAQRRAVAGVAEVILAKNRHGRTDTFECRFDGAGQRFMNKPGAEQEAML